MIETKDDVLKRTILLVADRPAMIEMIAKVNQPGSKWLRDFLAEANARKISPEAAWLLAGLGGVGMLAAAPVTATAGIAALASGAAIKLGSGLIGRTPPENAEELSDAALLEQLEAALKLPMPVTRMTVAEAMAAFRFGDSPMPRNRELYLRHPIWDNQYVPALEYPNRIIREKHAAFMKLAAALGAESITLKSVKVSSSSGGAKLKAPLEQIAGSLAISAKFDNTGTVMEAFTDTFAKPDGAPYVPDELQRWVETDTELERMAFNRMKAKALASRISLSTSSRVGLDADVLAKVADAEVSASANYLAAATSIWEFEVKYHPLG